MNEHGVAIRPKNTVIQTKNGIKYVYYVTDKVYLKDKKYNVNKRKCIGRMIDDSKMYINQFFKTYFPDVEVSETLRYNKSKVVKVGATTVLKSIFDKLQLSKYINACFSNNNSIDFDLSATIFNLASYLIVEESSSFQYYSHFARNHYTMDSSIENDVDISRFINKKISSKDQILEFNRMWFKDNVNNNRIYLSVDGTNINYSSEGVSLAEYGKAKDDNEEPIINLAIAFNHTNSRPLAYDLYKGSIVDMSQIKGFLKKINNFGLENVHLILDRGYFSKENIDLIMKDCCGFLMMCKENNIVIKEAIKDVKKQIESSRYYIPEYEIYGLTVKKKLFKQDLNGEERYFHIYFDSHRQIVQSKDFMFKIMEEYNEYKTKINQIINEKPSDYFIADVTKEKVLKDIQINYELVDKKAKDFGYFCIVSSNDLAAEEALTIYRSRDEIEKLYMVLKSHLGMNKINVHSDESIRGKFFIAFIATILRNELFTNLKELVKKDKKSFTVPAALKELDDIESLLNIDEKYVLDSSLTQKQKKICDKLGVRLSDFGKVNNELSSLVTLK